MADRVHRGLAACVFVFALCLAATFSAAQNQPKDEIFGGYSWLAPNGWGDLDYKINDIAAGFDASNTYYLSRAHNIGLVLDGSGHFNGGTTPRNLLNNQNSGTSVGYGLGGVQYKYHNGNYNALGAEQQLHGAGHGAAGAEVREDRGLGRVYVREEPEEAMACG